MAATLLGITGKWGVDNDETGLIIETLDFDFKDEEKKVKNKSGGTIGLSIYDETCDVQLKGQQTLTSPLIPKLAASLSLANTMPAFYGGTYSGGRMVIRNPKLSLNVEDFQMLDIKATHYPLMT